MYSIRRRAGRAVGPPAAARPAKRAVPLLPPPPALLLPAARMPPCSAAIFYSCGVMLSLAPAGGGFGRRHVALGRRGRASSGSARHCVRPWWCDGEAGGRADALPRHRPAGGSGSGVELEAAGGSATPIPACISDKKACISGRCTCDPRGGPRPPHCAAPCRASTAGVNVASVSLQASSAQCQALHSAHKKSK